jgi:hypothetical protein
VKIDIPKGVKIGGVPNTIISLSIEMYYFQYLLIVGGLDPIENED